MVIVFEVVVMVISQVSEIENELRDDRQLELQTLFVYVLIYNHTFLNTTIKNNLILITIQ